MLTHTRTQERDVLRQHRLHVISRYWGQTLLRTTYNCLPLSYECCIALLKLKYLYHFTRTFIANLTVAKEHIVEPLIGDCIGSVQCRGSRSVSKGQQV